MNTAGDDPRRFVYELSPPQRTELHRASVLVTLRDVTEQHRNELRQRALEREVIELQQLDALGRLAAGIAHDFNNVLVVIIGNAELALRDAPEEHPAHEPLRQILQAGLRSRELIAQLLVSVRPPARERRELSLQQVIADTVAMLKAGVPENVTVETELPEAPVVVMGSEVQLSQVFTNLLRNAIDAMPEGGRLTVTLGTEQSPAGAKAVVRVRDTGVGMDEATREQCFEYFYTTRAEGNGLGLAIVRSIVVSHRGRMEVDSAPGRGSEFRVLLPLLQPAPAQEGAAPHATASAPRVLLVDDEDEVRSALASGLRAHGYRVNGVAGGEAALEMLADRANVFDVVLTDLAMGDMSGVELAREIRRRRPELPIVLMAGREDREALRAGAECDRVLDKRISNGDLHSAIEELLAGAPRD